VGNQEIAARIGDKPLFQPGTRLYVQVVGGLIQEEYVGVFQEHFRQGNSHLPAPGEFFYITAQIAVLKTKAPKHHGDSGFPAVVT